MSPKKKNAQKRKPIERQDGQRRNAAQMPEQEAREYIERFISEGKYKEAIHALQQIPFRDAPSFVLLKIKAYAWRVRQLEDKGLVHEAAAVLGILSGVVAQVQSAGCRDMAGVVAVVPPSLGMHYYLQHQKEHPSCPWMERALADQLVISNHWEILSQLPDENPFKKDGLAMAEGAADFAVARWQEGLVKLTPLSRKSPFAPWRLFARAMASAYGGDEEALQKALKQLPGDFPLQHTVQTLRARGSKGLEDVHERVTRSGREKAQALVKAIHSRDRHLPNLIVQFAGELFPQYADMAIRSVSELAALSLVQKRVDVESIGRMLPAQIAGTLPIRIEMFYGPRVDPDALPFCMALRYLRNSEVEFPHVETRDRVDAAVYFNLLSRALSAGVSPGMLHERDRSCILQGVGSSGIRVEDLFVALAHRIVHLDPEGIPHYKSIFKQLNPSLISTEGKNLLEEALSRIRVLFPEDPFSYLELARVHWSRRAYRKSQKILEEAWKQAPYDPQVREYLGLGLLRSAVMGRRRSAHHLARKDLEEATQLNIRGLLPLIHALHATIRVIEKDDVNRVMESLLDLDEPVLRFRALIYFCRDLVELKEFWTAPLVRQIRKRIHKELKSELKRLHDAELMEIIAPVPREFSLLIGRLDLLSFFDALWPEILDKLNDQQVLIMYAKLLGGAREDKQIKWVKKDLQNRLGGRPKDVFFRFYAALVEYLLLAYPSSRVFEKLLQDLDEQEKGRLREFCRKISPNFEEPLARAMNFFNFRALDGDHIWREPGFEDEGDDSRVLVEADRGEDGDPFDVLVEGFKSLGGNNMLLEMLFEMLVAEIAAHKVSDEELRVMGFALEAKGKELVRSLRRIYSGKKASRLKREGRLILFPERI